MSLKGQALRVADFVAARTFAFNRKAPSYFYGDWLWLTHPCWKSLYLRYEANTAGVLRANLEAGDTFWDIGANFGLFSLFGSKLVGPQGHVVAVEPSPPAFELLRGNVKEHRSITALQYGIGDQVGEMLMSVQGASTGSSFVKEVVELSQIYHQGVPLVQVPVSIYTLDALLNQLALKPNLIKIDIEGYEAKALRGAERILAEVRPTLVIEIHPLQLKMSGNDEREVFDVLKRHDYGHEIFNRDESWALYSIIARPRNS